VFGQDNFIRGCSLGVRNDYVPSAVRSPGDHGAERRAVVSDPFDHRPPGSLCNFLEVGKRRPAEQAKQDGGQNELSWNHGDPSRAS